MSSTTPAPELQPLANLVRQELEGLDPPFTDGAPSPHRVVDPSEELYGLALSGGGIRSATFNLGLLQGLHGLGLLQGFHYVSTVSGGGYLGSFWSAWRSRRENQGKVFPEASGPRHCPESEEIRHLREFSNFLAPRLGLLSWDTGRLVVAALSSMLPSLVAAISLLLLAVLAWCGVVFWLFADPGKSPLVENITISAAVIGAITLALLVGAEVIWRRRKEKTSDRAYIAAAFIAIGTTVGAWMWIANAWAPFDKAYAAGQLLPVIRKGQSVDEWMYLFMPSAAWAVAVVVFMVLRWFGSSLANTHEMRVARTAFDRVQSRVLLLVVVWTAFAVLWCAGVWVYATVAVRNHVVLGTGLAGLSTLGTALFAWLQKRLIQQSNRPAGGKLTAVLRPLLPQVLAYAILGAMAVSTIAVLVGASVRVPAVPIPGGFPAAVALGALAAVGALLWCLDPNEVGLHAFYRGRLARAYPGASVPTGRRKTEEQETDDFPLQFMAGGAPCHLICCAANDLQGGGDMTNLNRGAESAVLSRVGLSVAEEWAQWQPGKVVPTLASAVTASGAAFNSLMGWRTIEYGPAVTFLMAAFNLRLGLWWPHPVRSKEQSLAERTLVGLPFFKEMFGMAQSRGRDVHLSDGGHFENLGVYELIRRHCRVIVVSDCGADPEVAFDDVGNLVRRVREDFGVDIRIDLSPLSPDPATGRARQPMVAGDIHYPEGDTGILLLFKPTLVGNEPADITQYGRRNKAFPHETTGDQFYDEAQWESYRRLGEHAACSAFQKLTRNLTRPAANAHEPHAADGYAAQVFNRARREWLPVPHGFADRVAHLADRVSELDELLRGDDSETLLREVYKEVDELDRWAKARVRAISIVGEGGRIAGFDTPPRWRADGGDPRDGGGAAPGAGGMDTRVEPAAASTGVALAADSAAGEGAIPAGAPPFAERATGGGAREEVITAKAPAPAAPGAAAWQFPQGKHLSSSLHLIRRALLVFEEAYEREDLERNHHHPVYLGLINYMARWAYAPLFRMWWPLLKTLYPQPFTRFMEDQFGLAEVGAAGEPAEHVVTKLSPERGGFAHEAWERRGGRGAGPCESVISYSLRMQYRNYEPPYEVQAAQVITSMHGDALVWNADDFFVPPGLWGVGIGEDFLRRLRAHDNGMPDVKRLLVWLPLDGDNGPLPHDEVADTLQLYRSAGFDRVSEDQLPAEEREAISNCAAGHASGGKLERLRWMYATVR